MSQNADSILLFERFPNEILFNIFQHLPAKSLVKCREVCKRWRDVINKICFSSALWRDFCMKDFKIYPYARHKSRRRLHWYALYRSMSLWPKLNEAMVIIDEFASASTVAGEILNFTVVDDHNLCVHTREGIRHYSMSDFKPNDGRSLYGQYTRFVETAKHILVMDTHLNFYVNCKNRFSRNVPSLHCPMCKMFINTEDYIYYVTTSEELYTATVKNLEIVNTITHEAGIVTMSDLNGTLYVLNYQREIYTLKEQRLVLVEQIDAKTNLMHKLYQYNFFQDMDWRIYYQWMFVFGHVIPNNLMQNILTVKSYGDIFFIGTDCGILRVYYEPYTDGELDLLNHEPLKQINLKPRPDCPVLSACPIIDIDVVEKEDGHIVFAAMPKKIAVIQFNHDYDEPVFLSFDEYSVAAKPKLLDKT